MNAQGPLTERWATVLAYVCKHPGCRTQEIAAALHLSRYAVLSHCEMLFVNRLVGRQLPLHHNLGTTWHPERKGLDAYERARASLEHGTQVEPSGYEAPAVAQGGEGCAAPALPEGAS